MVTPTLPLPVEVELADQHISSTRKGSNTEPRVVILLGSSMTPCRDM
jgi:hypothetical protein